MPCSPTDRTHTHLTRFPGGEFCTNCGHVSPPSGPGADAAYHWWETPGGGGHAALDTVALVAHWMAEEDYTAKDVAYAVEKPWKFTEEFLAAVRACAPKQPPSPLSALFVCLPPAG